MSDQDSPLPRTDNCSDGKTLEALFRSNVPARDNYLSRLFGMISEDIVRHWCRCTRAPYEDLGRPWVVADGKGHTLDFTLRHRVTGSTYIAELKAEMAWDGYRYMRLTSASQLDHHLGKEAFCKLLRTAREPTRYQVRVAGRPRVVDGAILVWGSTTPEGCQSVIAKYGLHAVLSLESMLNDLSLWRPSHWQQRVAELRGWGEELFAYLGH